MTFTVSRVAATLLVSGLMVAPPAVADETKKEASCHEVSDWMAPFDDKPCRQVRILGMTVPANEGIVDRSLRLASGVGLATVAAVDPWNFGIAGRAGAGVVGGIFTVTSIAGTCPLYLPFGWNSRMGKHEGECAR